MCIRDSKWSAAQDTPPPPPPLQENVQAAAVNTLLTPRTAANLRPSTNTAVTCKRSPGTFYSPGFSLWTAKHEAPAETEQRAPKRSKAWIPINLLVGQMVDVLRSNGTWSTGYVNSFHIDVPKPHLVIRFPSREWKRILVCEIDANIRPNAGNEILEDCFEPADAAPKTYRDSLDDDDELSDTEYLRACTLYEAAASKREAMSPVDRYSGGPSA